MPSWALLVVALLCAPLAIAGTIDDVQKLLDDVGTRAASAARAVSNASARLAGEVRAKTQDAFNKSWAEASLVGEVAGNAAGLLTKAQQACFKDDAALMQALANAATQTDRLNREATALVVQTPDMIAAINRTATSTLASGSQSLIDNVVNNLVKPLQTFLEELLKHVWDADLQAIVKQINAIDQAIADAPAQLAARVWQDTLAGFGQLDSAFASIQQKRLAAQQLLAEAQRAFDQALQRGCAAGGGPAPPPGSGSTSPPVPSGSGGGAPANPPAADSPLLFTMPNFDVGDSEVFEFDYYRFGDLPGSPRVEGRRTNVGFWLRAGAPMPGPLGICRAFNNAARQRGAEILYDNQRNIVIARLTRGGIESWGEIACDKDRYRLNLIDRPVPACTQPGCGAAPPAPQVMSTQEIKSPRDMATGQTSSRPRPPPASVQLSSPGGAAPVPLPAGVLGIVVDRAGLPPAAVACADRPTMLRRGYTKGLADTGGSRPPPPTLTPLDANTWSCTAGDGSVLEGALVIGK